MEETDAFKKEYREHKESLLRQSRNLTKSDPVPKPRELTSKRYPKTLPLEYKQHTVKQYIPPGHSVWRGNVRAEWWAHPKPYSRIVERLSDHANERDAINALLKRVWTLYLEKESLPHSACPIAGIFSEGGGAPASSAGPSK